MAESRIPGIKKNWKAIAGIGNRRLRELLIHCSGWVFNGAYGGWPQFFLQEGDQQEMLTRGELLVIAHDTQRWDVLVNCVKSLRIYSFRVSTQQMCLGGVYGPPKWVTEGRDYHSSQLQRGDTTEHEGSTWLVIWNPHFGDTFGSMTHYSFLMVRVDDLAEG